METRKSYNSSDYFKILDKSIMGDIQYMKADIYEDGEKYFISIDLPGIIKDNIKIDYENGYLAISAKKLNIENNYSYIRREKFLGEVKRCFFIGDKNEEDIKASYRDGILEISFPKVNLPKKVIKKIVID